MSSSIREFVESYRSADLRVSGRVRVRSLCVIISIQSLGSFYITRVYKYIVILGILIHSIISI